VRPAQNREKIMRKFSIPILMALCSLVFTNNLTAQVPLSQSYIACSNAKVEVGFETQAGTSYYWYNAAAGGTLLASNSNTHTITKDNSALQTVYAEPRISGIPQPRIAVNIELSEYCGETNPTGCATNGTLLWKEYFDS
jgi:hypothetical protein